MADSNGARLRDVVVVGAGLVGAAFACLLARSAQGKALKISVIEAKPFTALTTESGFDPRVVALTEKSRQMLENCGVWPVIEQNRISPYLAMDVWDAEGTGRIHFDCHDVHQPNLGHIVENSVIVEALLSEIDSLDNVELLCPAAISDFGEVTDKGVSVTLESGEKIQGKLLIAADGAHSKTREHFDFKTREWDYGHQAIVTTICTEKPNQQTAWQRFMSTGPLALLPLNRDGSLYYSSIVWSQESSEAERLITLDDETFCQELGRASENCLGRVVSADRRFAFPLRQRHATDYVKERVALLGDAAHTIHPLAGQGVNLGFADVAVLVEEINRALQRNNDIGGILTLERYQRRRKPDNLATMAAMEGFKRLFAADELPLRFLRNIGMSQVNSFSSLKNDLVKLAMGL